MIRVTLRIACVAALLGAAVDIASAQGDCLPNYVVTTESGSYIVNGSCPSEPPPFRLANLSGRSLVQPGDRVGIGGFIVGGFSPARVLIRGIGSSLKTDNQPLKGRLLDPRIELRGDAGELIAENDNWRSSPQAKEIQATTLAPPDDREAAVVLTLQPGAYTAVLRGAGDSQGIGLVEIYDLQGTAESYLANLASRAFVATEDNIIIGGFIIAGGPPKRVLLRGIGSSLAGSVPEELQDPTIELIDQNGATLGENDNWRSSKQALEIEQTGAAPSDDREAAIVVALGAGNYTALVQGKNKGTGNGVVEIYRLD